MIMLNDLLYVLSSVSSKRANASIVLIILGIATIVLGILRILGVIPQGNKNPMLTGIISIIAGIVIIVTGIVIR